MCGRYTLTRPEDLPGEFEISEVRIPPRFNIAPTQEAPVIRLAVEGRRVSLMRWGLVPNWQQTPSPSGRTINARAESLEQKPSFREALRFRRCLVPADGFFEWTSGLQPGPEVNPSAQGGGRGRKPVARRQPWLFRFPNSRVFAFAGLWDRNDRGPERLETFTIVTCEPAAWIRSFHDRMPVILPREHYAVWLDPSAPLESCQSLLVPFAAEPMKAEPVDPIVNSPLVDDPRCIEPLRAQQKSLFPAD